MFKIMKPQFIVSLDEYFCAQYSDYIKLCAIVGYEMPEIVSVGANGNIERKNSDVMHLCHQKNKDELLDRFKAGLADIEFAFNFSFPPFRNRLRDPFRKGTFKKVLKEALAHTGETAESAGKKLDVSPAVWQKIVKGTLYPEKNTIIALILATAMNQTDANNLFDAMGFTFEKDRVRDVVCEYLIKNGIFNEGMRDACLDEYKITNLPIKRN